LDVLEYEEKLNSKNPIFLKTEANNKLGLVLIFMIKRYGAGCKPAPAKKSVLDGVCNPVRDVLDRGNTQNLTLRLQTPSSTIF
jgi:hypothetical protein